MDSTLLATSNFQPQKSYDEQKQHTITLRFEKTLMDLFLDTFQSLVEDYEKENPVHQSKQKKLEHRFFVGLCHTFSVPRYYYIQRKLSTRIKDVHFVLFVRLHWEQLYPGDWGHCQVTVQGSMECLRHFYGWDSDWSDVEMMPNESQKQLAALLEMKLGEKYHQYIYSSLKNEIERKLKVNDLVNIVLHYLFVENQRTVPCTDSHS